MGVLDSLVQMQGQKNQQRQQGLQNIKQLGEKFKDYGKVEKLKRAGLALMKKKKINKEAIEEIRVAYNLTNEEITEVMVTAKTFEDYYRSQRRQELYDKPVSETMASRLNDAGYDPSTVTNMGDALSLLEKDKSTRYGTGVVVGTGAKIGFGKDRKTMEKGREYVYEQKPGAASPEGTMSGNIFEKTLGGGEKSYKPENMVLYDDTGKSRIVNKNDAEEYKKALDDGFKEPIISKEGRDLAATKAKEGRLLATAEAKEGRDLRTSIIKEGRTNITAEAKEGRTAEAKLLAAKRKDLEDRYDKMRAQHNSIKAGVGITIDSGEKQATLYQLEQNMDEVQNQYRLLIEPKESVKQLGTTQPTPTTGEITRKEKFDTEDEDLANLILKSIEKDYPRAMYKGNLKAIMLGPDGKLIPLVTFKKGKKGKYEIPIDLKTIKGLERALERNEITKEEFDFRKSQMKTKEEINKEYKSGEFGKYGSKEAIQNVKDYIEKHGIKQ